MPQYKLLMPKIKEEIKEAIITRLLKKEGDNVEQDEPVFEVETDKSDVQIPSPVSGIIVKILVTENEKIPIGKVMAIINF